MTVSARQQNKVYKPGKIKKRRIIFYSLMIALPVVQFCIFYIGVNANSLALAFQTFKRDSAGGGSFAFAGFANLSALVQELKASLTIQKALLNSVKVWALCTAITLPFALLFSFFIYKGMPLKNLFRFSLFLPSIIPGIVTVIIYMYFAERAIPALWSSLFGKEIQGLLANLEKQFAPLLFYNVFYSFGGYMLLFTSAMNTVDPSVREAAQIDGVKGFREFFHIVMPKVYPTLTTFLVLSVAGIFSNQFALYSFFGSTAQSQLITFGYYLYNATIRASYAEYPRLASMGILLTLIVVPVTLSVKVLLERVGPKE